MPDILQLRGPARASEFRLAKLVAPLRRSIPAFARSRPSFAISSRARRPRSTPAGRALLERLLAYGEPAPAGARHALLVVPRLGTLSPWSSKATDIAHNCGLAR